MTATFALAIDRTAALASDDRKVESLGSSHTHPKWRSDRHESPVRYSQPSPTCIGVCMPSLSGSTGVIAYQRRSETSPQASTQQDARRGGYTHSTKEGPGPVQRHTDGVTTEKDPSQPGERKENEISGRGLRIPEPEVGNL